LIENDVMIVIALFTKVFTILEGTTYYIKTILHRKSSNLPETFKSYFKISTKTNNNQQSTINNQQPTNNQQTHLSNHV